MSFQVTVSLDVPALPDNGVAFANSAAWVNYWSNINLNVVFVGADNAIYADSPYDNTLTSYTINTGSDLYEVPSKLQFDSFLLDYMTLKAAVKNMRTAMKAAGMLAEAQ